MNHSVNAYRVGPLLYCPASNETIVSSLTHEKFGRQFSLALCLEDAIRDDRVAEAEETLIASVKSLDRIRSRQPFFMPRLFLRVRNHTQIKSLLHRLGDSGKLIAGFNIPKFSPENADVYIRTICDINENANQTFYMMPILESPSIIDLRNRYRILYELKEKLDSVSRYVLNIRVGGNDLCHQFGFRRHSTESIHKIRPIGSIFSDIVTVFGMDYVISGPVWEYYSGKNWDSGLKQELNDDRLCGFIGKTVIHPRQIPLVNEAYRVPLKDYNDARSILDWDADAPSLVSGSIVKERMNEYKTHCNWALRTLALAEAYGLK